MAHTSISLCSAGDSPVLLGSEESACKAGDLGSIPGWRKIPWRRKLQATPVFLPGESHAQRNLVGYIQSVGSQRVRCDWVTNTSPWLNLPWLSEVSEVAQSCPSLCDPMDCSLLCSSVHGIFQARVLEWVAISFSKGSSWPRDRTQVSRTVGRRFTWLNSLTKSTPLPQTQTHHFYICSALLHLALETCILFILFYIFPLRI